MTPEQINRYDQQVAKQIDFLRSKGLELHIPRKGSPYFLPSQKPKP